MSLEFGSWKKYQDEYPEVMECTIQSSSMHNALPCYEYLYKFKEKVPKELYAYNLRRLLEFSTFNVSNEFKLKMLDGVDPKDIMYQDELDAIENKFPDYITIYRGASKEEDTPGMSWSIYKWVAENYYNGRLFKAVVPKENILVYISHNVTDVELVIHVTSNYEIIEED